MPECMSFQSYTPTFIIEPEVMHDVYYITLPNDRLSSGDAFIQM